MRDAFFGLGLHYDDGNGPCIAINRNGRVLDVHKNEAGRTLYYRAGSISQMTVNWGRSDEYTTGSEPAVAMNNNNRVVEVHESSHGGTVFSSIGTLNGDNTISWNHSPEDYTSGSTPSVALNDAGKVVEVHRSSESTRLYYRYGKLGATNVVWDWDDHYDTGSRPKVAINNSDEVVEVHASADSSTVWYRVGKIDEAAEEITFGDSHRFGDGDRPSVALTDAGDVIAAWEDGSSLMQRFGRINLSTKEIDWITKEKNFDAGAKPSVAAADGMAIEAHEGGILRTLWSSTAMITDRASWMTERRAQLGPLTMPQIVFPSSHDSGMYTNDGLSAFGKTQSLSIHGQLEYGIRYFDLRPEKSGVKIVIHHGVEGPDVSDVLSDIQRYCEQGYKELIIIDWSHFENWDASVYQSFVMQVDDAIGRWLYKETLQPGQRLADIPFSTFTANGPRIISAVSSRWAVDNPQPGFWVFRDWDASDSNLGHLVVFDKYSETMDYDQMRDDQLEKFKTFTGRQKHFPELPVDLFLLSWTLTPTTGVRVASRDANRKLGNALPDIPNPNQYNRIMNCLYVDYVEYARVTDVCIQQNEWLQANALARGR